MPLFEVLVFWLPIASLKQLPYSFNGFILFRRVFVGDVVILKDPEKSDDYLVRRLAAIEGYEMVSTDEKDKPFVLEEDECWVVSDNEALKPKVCFVGTFSPIYIL